MNPGVYRIIIRFAAVFLAVCIFSQPGSGRALTVEELQKQIDQKNANIKKLEADEAAYRSTITASQKTAKTLKNQIGQIDANIKGFDSKIRITNVKIEKANLEIEALEQGIADKEAKIARQKEGMAEVLRQLSKKDHETMLAVLIKNDSFSKFLGSINDFVLVQKRFDSYLSQLKQIRTDLGNQKDAAESKKAELHQLSDTPADQKSLQQSQRTARNQLLSQTKNKELSYQNLLKLNQAQQDQFQKELEALEEKLRVLVDPASLPSARKGFFLWPAEGRLSQGYGRTAFAIRSDFYSFHNGIDIANAYGTPILAPYDGRVVHTGDNDKYCPHGAYGKFILIDHGNNLTTLYGHLSLTKVSEGGIVKQGQLIGYMGISGLATGSHLHFTVYDSRTLEFKQSRVCGPMPYGGSVNPLDYL